MVDKIKPLILVLKNELQKGTYPVGSRFPSEYELADMFSINKKTANKVPPSIKADRIKCCGLIYFLAYDLPGSKFP